MSAGVSVLITQPTVNADALIAELTNAGFNAKHYPAVLIEWLKPSPRTQPAFVIATSPNAIKGSALSGLTLPQHCLYLAVGGATAKALNTAGINNVVYPKQAGSDALVELAAFKDCKNKYGWLLTGEGGRPLIEQRAAAIGAQLERINCYRRQANNQPAKLAQALSTPRPQLAIATSADVLDKLQHMADAECQEKLAQCHWLISSERIAQQLLAAWPNAGYSITNGPEATDLIAAAKAWRQINHSE